MRKELSRLIDEARFSSMMRSFVEMTGIPLLLVDGSGTALFSFLQPHISSPLSKSHCVGLTEHRVPVMVEGAAVATMVLGPVFLDEADRAGAIAALATLPVVPRERLEAARDFVGRMAELLAILCRERRQHRNAECSNSALEKAIAEERQVEQQLRRERDFSHAVINSLPGIFYLLDTEGRLVTWNRNMETLLGYSSEELYLLPALDLFRGPDRNRVGQRIAAVFERGRGEVEATIIGKNGRGTPHFFTGVRVVLDGEIYLVGLGIDITDRLEAAEILEEKNTALERSNAELEQFAYVASHDLREPLRMVTNYVTLLERRYADQLDADAHEFIGFAREGATRMDRLILDLLEYSRVGRGQLPTETIESEPILARAVSNLELAIRDAGASVEVAGNWPVVRGCPDELTRLFQNLISNALKYRRPHVAPVIRISCEPRAEQHLFSVADNGIGIDPQYAERIFLIFQRLHTRQDYEGTGIGLAICRKVVERHGGRLWVDSAPQQGSTFRFTLPGG